LFVLAGVLGFPVVAAFVLVAAPRLAALQYRSMPVLATNHLVTLGWGTMIAIGLLYQLLPAIAGVRREPVRLIPAHVAVHISGVAATTLGFLFGSQNLLILGASLVAISVLAFLGFAIPILHKRVRSPLAIVFMAISMICLSATVVWGWLLVLNWKFVFWRALLTPFGLAIHLALGLVGWFAVLVVGASYFLIPRFGGIGEVSAVRPRVVLGGLVMGLVLLLGGMATSESLVRVGALSVASAGLVYTRDLVWLIHSWRGQAYDITRAHWRVLTVETAVLSVGLAAWALEVLPGPPLRWGAAGVALFLLGWLTLAITGQAYKVTPFLMWYYRFRLGTSPLELSRRPAPYWPRAAVAPFVLLTAGGSLVALGALIASPEVGVAGGAAFFAGACLFAYLLGYSWLPALRAR
jgi:hypothetical protein